MGPFEMVVFIVAIACVTGMVTEIVKFRTRKREAGSDPAVQKSIRRLEERVAALEAIVTDGREDLRRRFQDLERHPRSE